MLDDETGDRTFTPVAPPELTWEDVRAGLRWTPARWGIDSETPRRLVSLAFGLTLAALAHALAFLLRRPPLFAMPKGEPNWLEDPTPPTVLWRWHRGAWLWAAIGWWRLAPVALMGGPEHVAKTAQGFRQGVEVQRAVGAVVEHAWMLRAQIAAKLNEIDHLSGPVRGEGRRFYTGMVGHLASYGGRTPEECCAMLQRVIPDGPVKADLIRKLKSRSASGQLSDTAWELARHTAKLVDARCQRRFDAQGGQLLDQWEVWEEIDALLAEKGWSEELTRSVSPKIARLLKLNWPRQEKPAAQAPKPARPEPAPPEQLEVLRGVDLELTRTPAGAWTSIALLGETSQLPLRIESVLRLDGEWWAVAERVSTDPGTFVRVQVARGRLACGHDLFDAGVLHGDDVHCTTCTLSEMIG